MLLHFSTSSQLTQQVIKIVKKNKGTQSLYRLRQRYLRGKRYDLCLLKWPDAIIE